MNKSPSRMIDLAQPMQGGGMTSGRARERFRCRDCRRAGRNQWFTLRFRAKRKRCTNCGSCDVYSQHAAQQRAEQKRRHLYCSLAHCRVPHPHRLGTHMLCPAHPGPVDMDILQAIEQRLILDYPNRTSDR